MVYVTGVNTAPVDVANNATLAADVVVFAVVAVVVTAVLFFWIAIYRVILFIREKIFAVTALLRKNLSSCICSTPVKLLV